MTEHNAPKDPACQRHNCEGCPCRKNLSDHDAIRQHMGLPATDSPAET